MADYTLPCCGRSAIDGCACPERATDVGFAVHKSLPSAVWAQVKRTIRTWRYARSIGADPTLWWGVYKAGTEICLASVGPLPGAEDRARQIDAALSLRIEV